VNKDTSHTVKLIEDCKKGKESAQFKVYKLYYKAMFNTAFRIMNDRYEAEDVMQEAFLSAFTKLNTFSGDVTFGAWIKRIVINKSLSELKKNNRLNLVPMEQVDVDRSEDEETEDYRIVEPSLILEKMKLLKSNYNIALTLHLIEGYDMKKLLKLCRSHMRIVGQQYQEQKIN